MGEAVGALGDIDFQAVVWGGGDALDALSGADFEHFAAFPYGFAVGREEDGGCAAYGDCHLKLVHVAIVAQDTRAENKIKQFLFFFSSGSNPSNPNSPSNPNTPSQRGKAGRKRCSGGWWRCAYCQ